MRNIKTYEGFFSDLFKKDKDEKGGYVPPAYKQEAKPNKNQPLKHKGMSGKVSIKDKDEPKNYLAIIYGNPDEPAVQSWVHDGHFKRFDTEKEVDDIISQIEMTGEYKGRQVKQVSKWSQSRYNEVETIINRGE